VAYYPNSDTKFQRFKKAFQGVEEHGAQPMQTNGFKTAPWLLKTGLTPQQVDSKQQFAGVPANRSCQVPTSQAPSRGRLWQD